MQYLHIHKGTELHVICVPHVSATSSKTAQGTFLASFLEKLWKKLPIDFLQKQFLQNPKMSIIIKLLFIDFPKIEISPPIIHPSVIYPRHF